MEKSIISFRFTIACPASTSSLNGPSSVLYTDAGITSGNCTHAVCGRDELSRAAIPSVAARTPVWK